MKKEQSAKLLKEIEKFNFICTLQIYTPHFYVI